MIQFIRKLMMMVILDPMISMMMNVLTKIEPMNTMMMIVGNLVIALNFG